MKFDDAEGVLDEVDDDAGVVLDDDNVGDILKASFLLSVEWSSWLIESGLKASLRIAMEKDLEEQRSLLKLKWPRNVSFVLPLTFDVLNVFHLRTSPLNISFDM